eukprot:g18161.t1
MGAGCRWEKTKLIRSDSETESGALSAWLPWELRGQRHPAHGSDRQLSRAPGGGTTDMLELDRCGRCADTFGAMVVRRCFAAGGRRCARLISDGFDGEDYVKYWLLFSTDDGEDLAIVLDEFFQSMVDGDIALDEGVSASSPSGSVVRARGRPANTFASRIAPLMLANAPDMVLHTARVWLIYGHVMTLKVMKLQLLNYSGCIGLSADDTTKKGRKITGVRIRCPWITRPLARGEITATIPLLPLLPRKITKKDILNVLGRNKSTRKQNAMMQDLCASAEMSATLAHIEDLCVPGTLMEDYDLAVTLDKGPLRKFFVNQAARGKKVTVFYDPHHVEDRACAAVSRRNLHDSVKHIMKTRSSSLGVHTPKMATALNIAAAELDQDKVLKFIGNLRDDLVVESGCLSNAAEHLVPAFKDQAMEMASKMGLLSNAKWMAPLYCCEIMEDRFTVFRCAVRIAYGKEKDAMKEQIAARKKMNKRKCITYVSYHKDDLDALQELIEARVKPLQLKEKGEMWREVDSSDSEDEDDEQDEPLPAGPAAHLAANNKQPAQKANAAAGQGASVAEGEPERQKDKDGFSDSDEDRKKENKKKHSEHVYKNRKRGFIENLFYTVEDYSVYASLMAHGRFGKPVVYAHGLQIGLILQNIETRNIHFRLPAIVCAQLAGYQRAPLTDALKRCATRCGYFAELLGQNLQDQLNMQMRIQLQYLSQHRRLFMYSRSDRLDRSVSKVLQDVTQSVPKALGWLLSSPEKFLSVPQLMGVATDGPRSGLRQVYCDDLKERNEVEARYSTKRLATHPLAFGHDDTRKSIVEWEMAMHKASKICERDDSPLVQLYGSYMDKQWNYYPIKKAMEFLERGQVYNCESWLTERYDCCINSTRDIEARGGGFTSATARAKNTGVLVEACPFFLAEMHVPETLPWLNAEKARKLLPEFADETEQLWKGKAVNRGKKTGVLETFSCLDGKAEYPDGCSENNFWNVATMEEVTPLVKPSDAMYLDKDKHNVSKDELRELERETYNVENIWRTLISELIMMHYGLHMQFQDTLFALMHRRGKVVAGWLRGLFEMYGALGWPMVLRVSNDKNKSTYPRYYLVLDVQAVLNTLVLIQLDRVHMGQKKECDKKDFFGKHGPTEPPAGTEAKASRAARNALAGSRVSNESSFFDNGDFDAPEGCEHFDGGWTVYQQGKLEADLDKVNALYFALPSFPEAYALPIQSSAGPTRYSRVKLWLCLSQTVAGILGECGEMVQVMDGARWVLTAGEEQYMLLKVPKAQSARLDPLEAVVKLGYGVREKWIHSAADARDLGADLQDAVMGIITENPQALFRLNENKSPDDWSLGDQFRVYHNRLKKIEEELSPHFVKLRAQVMADANQAPPSPITADQVSNYAFWRDGDQNPFTHETLRPKKQSESFGDVFDNIEIMDAPDPVSGLFENQQPSAAVQDVEMKSPENSGTPEEPSLAPKTPRGDLSARMMSDLPALFGPRPAPPPPPPPPAPPAAPQPEEKKETLLPPEDEPDEVANSPPLQIPEPRVEASRQGPEFVAAAAAAGAGMAGKSSFAKLLSVNHAALQTEFDNQNSPAVGNDDPDSREHELEIKWDEMDDLLGGDLGVPEGKQFAISDVRWMAQEVDKLLLSDRQWVEILYALVYGGRKTAAAELLKMGFYTDADEHDKDKPKSVVTMVATCQTFLVELQNKCLITQKNMDRIIWGDEVMDEEEKKQKKPKKPTKKQLKQNALQLAADHQDLHMGEIAGDKDLVPKPALLCEAIEENFLKTKRRENPLGLDLADLAGDGDAGGNAARVEELRAEYECGLEEKKKQLEEAKKRFPLDMDLCKLEAEEEGLTRELCCSVCGKQIAELTYKWVGSNCPQLRVKEHNGVRTTTRQLGEKSHVYYKCIDEKNPRCFCGYWKQAQLYQGEDRNLMAQPEDFFRCACKAMEIKVREQWAPCECPLKTKFKEIQHIPPRLTFGVAAKVV